MANIFQPNSSSSSSSSGTGKNYLSTYNNNTGNGDFETGGITGWSLAHSSLTSAFPSTVGTAGTAFSSAGGAGGGSAASGNLSLTASSSSPIAGTYTGVYASSAATTAGDMMISSAFTIDTEDQAKVMTFSFYYSATVSASNGNWSGTSSNSFGVAIYDVTNALWIMPAGVWSMTQSTLAGYATGTFQTTSNSTQYQLAVFNANATAGAITVKFDDLVVGPQTKPFGPAETDWVAYTPTINGAGTPATVQFFSRRKADTLEIAGNFVSGTVGATPFWVTPGFNGTNANVVVADSTKIAGGTYSLVGKMTGSLTANPSTKDFTAIAIAGSSVIYFGQTRTDATVNPLAPGSGTTLLVNATQYSMFAAVPIQGWSSNSAMSQDTDTRVVAALVTGDPASATVGNPIIVPTITIDTHGSYNATTGRYTCPVSGIYKVFGALLSASSATTLTVYKNAVSTSLAGNLDSNGEATFCTAVNCVAGDIIDLRPGGTVDATSMTLNIMRVSGPSVVAASETVAARYRLSADRTPSANAQVNYDTSVYDTHSAVTTGASWKFTAPVSGFYRVSGIALVSAISSADVILFKNGSIDVSLLSLGTTSFGYSFASTTKCNAGDTLDLRPNAGSNTFSSANTSRDNQICIELVK